MIRKKVQGMVTAGEIRGDNEETSSREENRGFETPGRENFSPREGVLEALSDMAESEDVPNGGPEGRESAEKLGFVATPVEKPCARIKKRRRRVLRLSDDEDEDDDLGVAVMGVNMQEPKSSDMEPVGVENERIILDKGGFGSEIKSEDELKVKRDGGIVTSSQPDAAEKIPSPPTPVVGDVRDNVVVAAVAKAQEKKDLLPSRDKEAASVHGSDDESAQFELERKKRRRLNDDLAQSKKGVNAVWMKRAADSKIDRQSVLLLDRKPVHKMARDTASGSSKMDEVYSRKTVGNSAKIYTRSKFDKGKVKSNADVLLPSAPVVEKSELRMANGAAIEKLKQGIVLKHNARSYSTKSGSPIRYERKKSQQRAASSALDDDVEIRSLLHEKKNSGAALAMESGRKSLGQNSFAKSESDGRQKKNATFASPERDSFSSPLKRKKMSRSLPPVINETPIPKSSPSLGRVTKTTLRIARSEERRQLRERLKHYLLDAGWSIDLRPRKGKNYDDNVYISPAGTSFWSLPKAWDALKKNGAKYDGIQSSLRAGGSPKAETSKPADRGSQGCADDGNKLVKIVSTEDLSLLKRKRKKERNDQKGGVMNKNKKAIKAMKNERVFDKGGKNKNVSIDGRSREETEKIKVNGLEVLGRKLKGSEKKKIDGKLMQRTKVADFEIRKEHANGKLVQRSKVTDTEMQKEYGSGKLIQRPRVVDPDLHREQHNGKLPKRLKVTDPALQKEWDKKGHLKIASSAQNMNFNSKTGPRHLTKNLHGDHGRKQRTPKAASDMVQNSSSKVVTDTVKSRSSKAASDLVKSSSSKAISDMGKGISSQGKKNKRRGGGCGLLVRSSGKGDTHSGDEGVVSAAKRTVLSWLIDVGVVPENECLQYWNKKGTRVMLEGWVSREGVLCECCNCVISLSEFETHAGGTRRQPFQNIYLQSGKSLTQCQMEAWDTQDESRKFGKHVVEIDEDDQNDDTCGLCGDGGDLICCDKCPSTFHQDCLGLKSVPEGDWYCLNCTCGICKSVGYVSENPSSKSTAVLFCEQCEHEYHKKCLHMRGIESGSSFARNSSFCGQACEKVSAGLDCLLGVSNALEGGFSWSLLRRFDEEQQMSSTQGLSMPKMADCNAKLAVSHIVMDECFVPIIDPRTNIDMVSHVVFSCWSNFNRLNYKGFYTVVLEKDDEFISVASIRIYGRRLAEMPLIGTRHHFRRQGMCRRLVNAIEQMLASLQVEKLVLPAIPDLLPTWTKAFGFKPLEDSDKQEIRNLNLMVFPGTDLLQKRLCKSEIPEDETTGGKECTHRQSVTCKEDVEHQTNFGVKGKIISDNVLSISGGGEISCTKIVEDCASEPAHTDRVEIDSDIKPGECS